MTGATTLRERALRLLARREHSRVELRRKLSPFAADPEELNTLIEDLISRRLLSDDRYAEERTRVLSRRYGSARIAHDLASRGVSHEVVERTVAEARRTDFDRAREAWRKRFGEVARSIEERGKQIRFLQGRGFSMDIISRVMRANQEDFG